MLNDNEDGKYNYNMGGFVVFLVNMFLCKVRHRLSAKSLVEESHPEFCFPFSIKGMKYCLVCLYQTTWTPRHV